MSAQYPTAATANTRAADLLRGLAQRLKGPGGLYNLGNAIGFTGGLVAALIAVPAHEFGLSTALAAAVHYVSGTPAAMALTLATIIFFWSGEQYHRAWSNGFPPDPARNRIGDLSSAVGAILLALAFFALGNVLLALTAGLLHAAGKGGSALIGSSRKPEGESHAQRHALPRGGDPEPHSGGGHGLWRAARRAIPPRASSLPCCSPAA